MKDAEKEKEVSAEMFCLQEKREEIHDRIGILIDRLSDVLSVLPPTEERQKPRKAYSCQLAQDLENVTDSLSNDINRINDILGRLEL